MTPVALPPSSTPTEGNYDLVGNNLPVFFIRDAMKFHDMVYSLKPAPNTNIQDGNRYWDLFGSSPTWGFRRTTGRGCGFGVHTFKWVNAQGKEYFVKYHWTPKQGVVSLTNEEASQVGDHQHATRDLCEAIDGASTPSGS